MRSYKNVGRKKSPVSKVISSYYIDEEIVKVLDKIANDYDIDRSSIVNNILREKLKVNPSAEVFEKSRRKFLNLMNNYWERVC